MSSKEVGLSSTDDVRDKQVNVDTLKLHSRKDLPRFGVRQTLGLMGFLGTSTVFTMRVDLSVAIRAMVINTEASNKTKSDSCPLSDDYDDVLTNQTSAGELNWDEQTQGIILASFFYGYALTNIIGGRAAERYGSRFVLGIGIILTSFFTLFSPFAARSSSGHFIANRFLIGLSQGVYYPGMAKIITEYYPHQERSKFTTNIFLGAHFGTVVTLVLSGILSDSEILGGWPSVFYLFGGLGIMWGIAWIWLIRDDPSTNPWITKVELDYIMEGIPEAGKRKDHVAVPWKSIFTCVEFYSLAVMHFGFTWGLFTLITVLPTYLDQILHFGLKSNGLVSAMPYLGTWMFGLLYSGIIDRMIVQKKISILNVRRLSMILAGYGPALMLLIMCFVNCHSSLAVVILVLSGILSGPQACGYLSSHADLSPRFAGTLMGLTNTFATIPGFISPVIAGAITQNNQTLWAWRQIFILATIIIASSTTFYVWKFDAKMKDWNDIPSDKNNRPMSANQQRFTGCLSSGL